MGAIIHINSVMNKYNDILKLSYNLQKENLYLKQEIEKLKGKNDKFLEFSQIILTMLFVSIILNFFFCIKEQ